MSSAHTTSPLPTTTTSTSTSTPSNTSSAQPPAWTAAMSAFAHKLLRNGEDCKSVTILLETEWPMLEGKVSTGWIERLRGV